MVGATREWPGGDTQRVADQGVESVEEGGADHREHDRAAEGCQEDSRDRLKISLVQSNRMCEGCLDAIPSSPGGAYRGTRRLLVGPEKGDGSGSTPARRRLF